MVTYRIKGLPDGSEPDQDFEFILDDSEPIRLRIPGEQRGPDVCIPDSPAQERWLLSRGDLMVPYWDCEWTFVSGEARQAFIELIEARSV